MPESIAPPDDHAEPEPRRQRGVYSIGAVSRMLGVPAATLRTWQERYAVVVPHRSDGGHRLYTRQQVEQLRFVADQVAGGASPGDAHRLLRERLTGGGSTMPDRGSGKVSVLLVARDPFSADFVEYFLRTEGYQVRVVVGAEEALAGDPPPDVAIVDLMIAGRNGLDLCRDLRVRAKIPVLAISTIEQRDSALAAGADAFLLKPVQPLQLVSVVKDLLGASALVRRERAVA